MSGVLLKVGVYGFVRIMSLLIETPLWAGALVFFLGAVSALFALAFALAQHDFKRMLAYSSVENVGIIFLGIGLAMIGRSLDQIAWVALGLGGALYHVWNHAAFKSLLFLTSGSLIHATQTRETERLGGLAKSMPWTAVAFAIGAVSAAALPPFNGFASEFLLYLGLFRTLGIEGDTVAWPAASFVAPALAVIGALAAACFVGVFGVIFLGTPRTDSARHAHEAGPAILVPLTLLSALCLLLGMTPAVIEPVLDRALTAWSIDLPTPRLNSLAPLGVLTVANAVLIMLSLVVGFWLRWRLSISKVEYDETWGCGYTGATARIQYTASSFTQSLVKLFSWVIFPRIYLPHVRGLFPRKGAYSSHAPDVILNDVVSPGAQVLSRIFRISRWVQQGDIHAYLLYILAVVVVLLLWS
jgi:hydrogenase-4 component B